MSTILMAIAAAVLGGLIFTVVGIVENSSKSKQSDGGAYSANRFEKRSGDRWRILLLPKSPKRTVRRQMPLI